MVKPTAGSGTIFGKDIVRDSVDIRVDVGYLPQDFRFYEHMSARQTLDYTAKFFFKGPQVEIDTRVNEMLELVGLMDKADRAIKGFLFTYALIALPALLWLNGDSGKRIVASFARLAIRRGGLLIFAIPLILIGYILQPFVHAYTGWASFFFLLVFFIFGYILIADERFMRAVCRDWLLHLILGIICTLFFFSVAADVPVWDWLVSPGTSMFYVSWTAWGINSWCWTMVMMYIGMRYLDTSNNWLQYGREASYPFYFFHQPAIIFIAFYALQWEVNLLVKLLVVVVGSFALSLGLYDLLVRRINPVRALFGMKPRSS